MEYYAIVTSESLEHHGIKGQRWGIRRYQNFDGSYTKAGLKRYYTSEKEYQQLKNMYKSAKKSRKTGEDIIIRDSKNREVVLNGNDFDMKELKSGVKTAKKKMNKDYNHLKIDKQADKGKERYANGERITFNNEVSHMMKTIGGMTVSAAAFGYNKGYIDKKTASALAAVGGLTIASSVGRDIVKTKANNQLRAYYAHTSNY